MRGGKTVKSSTFHKSKATKNLYSFITDVPSSLMDSNGVYKTMKMK